MFWTWLINTKIGRFVSAVATFAAIVLFAWLRGKNAGQEIAEKRMADKERETRQRMDDAEIIGDDPAVARDWLRERSGK